MSTPDYFLYKPPIILIDADSDTEFIDSSDSDDSYEMDT